MAEKCGAKTRSGGKCGQPRARGRTRCRNHGGATLRGEQAPGYVHGRYCKAFGAYGEQVDQAMRDPELLDVRRGVAGALAALEHAGDRLQGLDTPGFRKRALDLYRKALDGGTQEMAALGAHLEKGADHDVAFARVVKRSGEYADRVESAQRLQLGAQNALTSAEATAVMRALVQIVLQRTRDPSLVLSCVRELDRGHLGGRLARAGISLVPREIAAHNQGDAAKEASNPESV